MNLQNFFITKIGKVHGVKAYFSDLEINSKHTGIGI
jgi:hypothetical protein